MNHSETLARAIAQKSLELGAIKINTKSPFQWASGFFMPVYNDNRILLSDFKIRKTVVEALATLIEEENIKPENIAGIPTAGLPWGVMLAEKLSLPFMYVRDKAKEHGLKKQIEGVLLPGQKCVIVEDVISTGGSAAKAIPAIREEGGEVSLALGIYSYHFQEGIEKFEKEGVKLRCTLTYKTLMEVARETKTISDDDFESLLLWQKSPFTWGEERGFKKIEK